MALYVREGLEMKKTYQKPTLVRRDNIRKITAQDNGGGFSAKTIQG